MASENNVTVQYTTANGTASADDYIATSGTLDFAPGETSKQVNVSVIGDVFVEPTEFFFVNLGTPTNAKINDSQGQATIINDDEPLRFDKPVVFRGRDWFFDLNGDGLAEEKLVGYGLVGDTPVVGDWNGDGKDDIAVVRPNYQSGGLDWYLDFNNDGIVDRLKHYGLIGDTPVVGDWNGDGYDDMGIVRYNAWRGGLDWAVDSNGDAEWQSSDAVWHYGLQGDIPVVGDWNADGRSDMGVVRDNLSRGGLDWYVDSNGDAAWQATDAVFQYGLLDDIPVVGDWNGDGKDDMGVAHRDPVTNFYFWYVDLNNGADVWAEKVLLYGIGGDRVLAGKW